MSVIEKRVSELERNAPTIATDTVTRIYLVPLQREGETAPELQDRVELWRHPDWERIEKLQAEMKAKKHE